MTAPREHAGSRTPPRIGPRIVAVLLCAFAINALAQGVRWTLGWDTSPFILGAEQWLSGSVALAAAIGAWRHAPWAPAATALYALLVGTLIGTLGPVLELDAEASRSVMWSGLAVAGMVFGIAFYLWRALRPANAD